MHETFKNAKAKHHWSVGHQLPFQQLQCVACLRAVRQLAIIVLHQAQPLRQRLGKEVDLFLVQTAQFVHVFCFVPLQLHCPIVAMLLANAAIAKPSWVLKFAGRAWVAAVSRNGIGEATVRDKALLMPEQKWEEGIGCARATAKKLFGVWLFAKASLTRHSNRNIPPIAGQKGLPEIALRMQCKFGRTSPRRQQPPNRIRNRHESYLFPFFSKLST